MWVPDREGHFRDVVLAFDNLDQFMDKVNSPSDFGAVIGRYANRIGDGHLEVDGKVYLISSISIGAILTVLHCVNLFLDMLCPRYWGLRLIECLPRDWFADTHGESVVLILEKFIRQEEHRDVELDAQRFADVGKTVEEVRISSLKIDGHYVALRLYALRDEGFLPFQVANYAIRATRTKAGGKHNDVVVARKACLNNGGEVATLLARLVDGNEERSKPVKVHE